MVTPGYSIEVHHADRDDSSATIHVEGQVSAGRAACLMPRRYRKKPEWWVIEVAAVEAPTEDVQQFRLSCAVDGMWGTEGIEIVGPSSSVRIPRSEPRKLGSKTRKLSSESHKLNSDARRVSSSADVEPNGR